MGMRAVQALFQNAMALSDRWGAAADILCAMAFDSPQKIHATGMAASPFHNLFVVYFAAASGVAALGTVRTSFGGGICATSHPPPKALIN